MRICGDRYLSDKQSDYFVNEYKDFRGIAFVNKTPKLSECFTLHCFYFVFSMERLEPPVFYGSINILIWFFLFLLLKWVNKRVNGETMHASGWISMFWYVIPVKKIGFIPFQQVLEMFEYLFFLFLLKIMFWFSLALKIPHIFCVFFCLLCVMFVTQHEHSIILFSRIVNMSHIMQARAVTSQLHSAFFSRVFFASLHF